MEGLLQEFINVHFIKNFLFLGKVAKEWSGFVELSRSQREVSPLKEDDDFFLGGSERKPGLHSQTPLLSSNVKEFFQTQEFREFSQFALTSYGSITDSFSKFGQFEKLLQFSYINSESFARSDLSNVVRALNVILPGNNFFWRISMRFLLETSQSFFTRIQFAFLKEKTQGFKDCLELFNKLVIRDFLERYLGNVEPNKPPFQSVQQEQSSLLNSQQPLDQIRTPLTSRRRLSFNKQKGE